MLVVEPQEFEDIIRAKFPDAEIKAVDVVGDRQHYRLEIASQQFAGLSRIEQHKLVHAAMQGTHAASIHAISLQTRILEESK